MTIRFGWRGYSMIVSIERKGIPAADGIPDCCDSKGQRATCPPGRGVRKWVPGKMEVEYLFRHSENVKSELRLRIRDASIRKKSKHELLLLLLPVLRACRVFTVLPSPAFQVGINHFINEQMDACYFLRLSEEELLVLWSCV